MSDPEKPAAAQDPIPATATRPPRKKYVKAVGPRLHKLLVAVLLLVALLVANSVFLAAITALEWYSGKSYQDYFYMLMFLAHLVLGLLLVVPLIVFGCIHMAITFRRKNRRAVRAGYALFLASIVVLATGILLVRISGVYDLKNPLARNTVYWAHIICPCLAGWLYWLHRLAGPRIKWRLARTYLAVVAVTVIGMVALHAQDPREWNQVGPASGEQYFKPSLARTVTGNFIPDQTMMMDQYCLKCHADVHAGWRDSAHHFSSFNNPAYLATIRETRKEELARDGNVQASRWCAGCHDPVPFLSGAFDDPKFDDVGHPTAHAGITCTVCHAITHFNSNRGNADYTIEEPQHYPFAFSKNPMLQWINNQLVKAKPSFHKQVFLKPLHKQAEFCSVCHKVSLPFEVNHYKKFLRGQNHYDSYLLSGVSGHGARSFYYPAEAQTNCNGCHMPLKPSRDFGARAFGTQQLSIHDHLFPSANTAVAWWRDKPDVIAAHRDFLQESMRVDIFGIREEGSIDGKLHAPLRPEVPTLQPGETYLLETVIRTLKLGHLFTQGTVDSNQIWLEVRVRSGERIIGRSGSMSDKGRVDPWSHFVNAFVVDREGHRINRRNAQDIFVAVYNNQIPPGAGQTVHYRLQLPADLKAPVTVDLQLKYRKFDSEYLDFIARSHGPNDPPLRGHEAGQPYHNPLPIVTLASDRITFPVAGVADMPNNATRAIPEWQRWNDYGIGLLLKGKSQLRQAADAFREVCEYDRYDGPLNLARTLYADGSDYKTVVELVQQAAAYTDPPAPPWTLGWLSGLVNRDQGRLQEAEENFRSVLEDTTEAMRSRHLDFSKDYVVINLLGQTLYDQARQIRAERDRQRREDLLKRAEMVFRNTLKIDSENVTAHYNLQLLLRSLGREAEAETHRKLYEIYKPDDDARSTAVAKARTRYPAANNAAEAVVIYDLHRTGSQNQPAATADPASSGDVK